MTAEVLAQLILQFGVIPALFIWLLYDTRKESKELLAKSQDRETKLMEHIARSDETQKEITASIVRMTEQQEEMNKNMGFMQRDLEELKAK